MILVKIIRGTKKVKITRNDKTAKDLLIEKFYRDRGLLYES